MKTLPKLPSKLIRLALKDLEKCEKSPKYRIDMNHWHMPNGACSVCLAGSVMAQTLRVPHKQKMVAEDFPELLRRQLTALDFFRCGYVAYGVLEMQQLPSPACVTIAFITDYKIGSTAFKRDMRKMADKLEECGL